MNSHLAEKDVLQWVAGERPSDLGEHLGSCPDCASRVTRLEGALGDFRAAVRASSQAPAPSAILIRRRPVRMLRWATAAAALLGIAAVPVYRHQREEARRAELARDAILLQQVDAEVSEAVPTSMAPLVKLVSWDSEKGEMK
jgi:hypothetical protein